MYIRFKIFPGISQGRCDGSAVPRVRGMAANSQRTWVTGSHCVHAPSEIKFLFYSKVDAVKYPIDIAAVIVITKVKHFVIIPWQVDKKYLIFSGIIAEIIACQGRVIDRVVRGGRINSRSLDSIPPN